MTKLQQEVKIICKQKLLQEYGTLCVARACKYIVSALFDVFYNTHAQHLNTIHTCSVKSPKIYVLLFNHVNRGNAFKVLQLRRIMLDHIVQLYMKFLYNICINEINIMVLTAVAYPFQSASSLKLENQKLVES